MRYEARKMSTSRVATSVEMVYSSVAIYSDYRLTIRYK